MPDNKPVSIEIYDSGKEWAQDLHAFDHSIFHHPGWISAVCSQDNLTPLFMDFFIDGEKIGKISGVQSGAAGRISQVYFYAGPALKSNTTEGYRSCITALKHFATARAASNLTVGSYGKAYAPFVKLRQFSDSVRREYIVALDDETGKRYAKSIRHKIKKAVKISPAFRTGDMDFEPFRELLFAVSEYRLRNKRERYNPYALMFVNERVIRSLMKSDICHAYSAVIGGEACAAVLTVEGEKRVSWLYAGMKQQYYQHGLNTWLIDQVFRHLRQKGYRTMNLGGVPQGRDGNNLAFYKMMLGAKEVVLHSYASYFLNFPKKLLNPLVFVGRKLPRDNRVIKTMKEYYYKMVR